MKNKYSSLLCILISMAGLQRGLADDPSLYYYFEDNNDNTMPTNSGDAPFAPHYLGDTTQTTTQHKFGKGSMLIGAKKGPVPILTNAAGFAIASEFNDAIRKLTITLWVRPVASEDGKGSCFNPGFNILGRYAYDSAGNVLRGTGAFNYSFAYGTFNFTYCDENGKPQSFSSSQIKFIETEEWVQMAVTFDEGKVVFYYNGVPVGDGDGRVNGGTGIAATQGATALVGFNNSLPGDCIDDFGVFVGRALTESEIDKLYNRGLEDFVKPAPKAAPPAKK
ncbi:MAG: LamG-like jellyroll fold domain-containing protein [Chthoniobacterales bacterium]